MQKSPQSQNQSQSKRNSQRTRTHNSTHNSQHKRKERIALIVSTCDEMSGAVRVGINLANRFCEDYQVYVLYVYGSIDQHRSLLDQRVITHAFLPHELRQREAARQLYRPLKTYLKTNAIEVAFVHGIYTGAAALPVAATTSTTRFVFCDHSAIAKREGQKDRADTIFRHLFARFYDAVVTLTEQNRQDYLRRFHIKPAKVQAIYNWVNPELLSRNTSYHQDAKKMLWAGRLAEEKGLFLLLEIAKKVLPSRPDWCWDLFGTGEMEQELATQIAQSGLQEQLILKGFASDIYALYPSYAAVTLTSYREGLPMVLLEGKASGLPLIAFDVITGPREIIRDGVDGFLVSPYNVDEYAEKLGQLMDDPQLRQTMSDNAHQDITRFSPEPIYRQWQALLERID